MSARWGETLRRWLARRRARVALGLAAALATVAAVVPVATAGTEGTAGTVNGHDGRHPRTQHAEAQAGTEPLQQVRDATRRYRSVDRAIDAGYVQFLGCVHEPLAGSMGIHFVNATLAGDTTLDPGKPEALVYEAQPNGGLTLVAAEYIVFQEAWEAQHDQPPLLFGEPFMLVPSPNRYGIPAFYALHAWAWKDNPTGSFTEWNPKVLCLGTEGHQH
jgi:hypothetical protein